MKTHAYMDSQRWSNRRAFTEQNVKCILHLRKGDSIPLFIGRGRDGDRVGMIVPDIQEGYVVFIYESRYGDSFAFLCKNENEAKERLEAQIKSPTFNGGLVSGTDGRCILFEEVKVERNDDEHVHEDGTAKIVERARVSVAVQW